MRPLLGTPWGAVGTVVSGILPVESGFTAHAIVTISLRLRSSCRRLKAVTRPRRRATFPC